MASFGTTTKWALRYLLGGSNVNEIDDGFAALANDLDPKLTPYDEGLLAARPVSTSGTPGKKGRAYRATDDLTGGPNGSWYLDYGTGWIIIPPLVPADASIAPAKLLVPRAKRSKTANQTIGNNASTVATVPVGDYAVAMGGSSTGITVPSGGGGLYDIKAALVFAGGSNTGVRALSLFKNGTLVQQVLQLPDSFFGVSLNIALELVLAATDVISIGAYQNSGGNLDVTAASLSLRQVA